MKKCPCDSGKEYALCCKSYHEGTPPENALLLMRSRYSAYALHRAAYIMETTHPHSIHYTKNRKEWLRKILNFCQNTQFEKLEIIDFSDGEKEAFVTFTAHLSQKGRDASFQERSRFEKVQDKWLYCEGTTYPLS